MCVVLMLLIKQNKGHIFVYPKQLLTAFGLPINW